MNFDLSQIAKVFGAASVDTIGRVSGWSVDSRTIEPGDLYFALRGPNHDGHDFVRQAFEKGALAAVCEKSVQAAGTVLRVADSLNALHQLATWARKKWGGQVVGVTGSAGKTTTKDAITHLLAVEFGVSKTTGNYNNHVGLPLSVLRLPGDARVAVLELGMNHAGEIRKLSKIAMPDIGVVTNVGHAHMENFESIEAVALAKRELIEALPPGGVAILNADDLHASRFRESHPGRTITFGLSEGADVRAEQVEYFELGARFRVESTQFETQLAGKHGVMNMLAAIAVARLFNISLDRLLEPVRSFAPPTMRGRRFVHSLKSRGDVVVFDDCYNANPEAVRSMVDVLRGTPARRRIAVLGEMLELGRWTEDLHCQVGRHIAESGIDVLVGIRGAARYMVDAAVEAGLKGRGAFFFEDPATAGDHLRRIARNGDAILFKGSRGAKVETALESFLR